MTQFLKIAEQIYKRVQVKKGFSDDLSEDLNNLMIELRAEIKISNLRMLYNYINFEELLMSSKKNDNNLDISIIPKSKNVGEYVLWLSGFIEKITIVIEEKNIVENKVIMPNYYYDDLGNIVDGSIKKSKEIDCFYMRELNLEVIK